VTGNWFRCEWYDYSQATFVKRIDPSWLTRPVATGVNFVYKAFEWTWADTQAIDTWYFYDAYGNIIQKQDRGPEWRWTDT